MSDVTLWLLDRARSLQKFGFFSEKSRNQHSVALYVKIGRIIEMIELVLYGKSLPT